MKTVTLNQDNRSILICEDTVELIIQSNHVRMGEERIYGIGADTVTLHEGVTVPEDWKSSKYFFDGTDWTLNEAISK
jgi:hypothetical protein